MAERWARMGYYPRILPGVIRQLEERLLRAIVHDFHLFKRNISAPSNSVLKLNLL